MGGGATNLPHLCKHSEDFCQASITDPDLAAIKDVVFTIRGKNCFGFDGLKKNHVIRDHIQGFKKNYR